MFRAVISKAMSPDRRINFADLRRIIDQREAVRRSQQDRLREPRLTYAEELLSEQAERELRRDQERQEKIAKAQAILQESSFPALTKELKVLYNAAYGKDIEISKDAPISQNRTLEENWRGKLYHQEWRGEFPYSRPVDAVILFASWWGTVTGGDEGLAPRRGFAIEAFSTGNIPVTGAQKINLGENEWRDNLDLQARAVEAAFRQPLVHIVTKGHRSDASYLRGGSPESRG